VGFSIFGSTRFTPLTKIWHEIGAVEAFIEKHKAEKICSLALHSWYGGTFTRIAELVHMRIFPMGSITARLEKSRSEACRTTF
jgi:hypothetical protein